jgi:dihydroorotase
MIIKKPGLDQINSVAYQASKLQETNLMLLERLGLQKLPKEPWKFVDIHVHDRGENQSEKATPRSTVDIGMREGAVALVRMPNTDPAITTIEDCKKRIRYAKEQGIKPETYYMYVGATRDPAKVESAFLAIGSIPQVVAMKLYAGKTTGDLEILEPSEQRMIFRIAKRLKFRGTIGAHAEMEKLARPNLWDPRNPASWNEAKPPRMEIEAVKTLITIAAEEGFEGHLHICHVSTPEAVELVNDAKAELRISCCVTPHHLLLSTADMQTPQATILRVNPPIRTPETRDRLMALLKDGKINGIESDYAPHRPTEQLFDPQKQQEKYVSGIRYFFENSSSVLTYLRTEHGFTRERLKQLTFYNPLKILPKVKILDNKMVL